MPTDDKLFRRNFGLALVSVIVFAASLAPWLRNRGFINDLLDYGLVIVGNARVADGERPFVDFVTPLQSGFYWMNHGIERLLGHSFQAMTLANGYAIFLGLAFSFYLLSRRLPPLSALIASFAIIIGSLGQHTVVWYNAVGVIALAYVSWSTALAPVVNRATVWWHLLTFIALIVGGTNKLNFHLVALAGAIAWAIRAGVHDQKLWRRVWATIAIWLGAGLVVPVLLELAWTGASWAEWRYNVLEMAATNRGGHLSPLLGIRFYLDPLNQFYGPTLGPVGAIGIIWLIATVTLGWRNRSLVDRFFLVGAAVFAMAGWAGMMATNHEIVYVTLAAGIVVVISIWLGFDLTSRPIPQRWLLTAPCLILGAIMWQSAWQGQRALFGHNVVDRQTFRELKSLNREFDYLKGTRFPVPLALDLEDLATHMPPLPESGEYPYFYSTGLEWLEEIWPARNLPKMPLLQTPVAFTQIEADRLREAFSRPQKYDVVLGMMAWGTWPAGLGDYMSSRAKTRLVGGLTISELQGGRIAGNIEPQDDALAVLRTYGGNVDRQFIKILEPLWSASAENGQSFLASESGLGVLLLEQPTRHLRGEAIVSRKSENLDEEHRAVFTISTVTNRSDVPSTVLWNQTVVLSPLQTEIRVPYEIQPQNFPTQFSVEVPAQSNAKFAAGWRLPHIQHLTAELPQPPRLRAPYLDDIPIDQTWKTALLPAEWVDKFEVVARGAQLREQSLELSPGGEIWLKPLVPITGIFGRARLTQALGTATTPILRVVWYKGGRLEIEHQEGVRDAEPGWGFKAWPAELNGRFGLLLDKGSSHLPVRIHIDSVEAPP